MQKAMSDVENAISRIDFPDDTKKPKITKAEFYDIVTRIVLSGNLDLSQLRSEAKIFKENPIDIAHKIKDKFDNRKRVNGIKCFTMAIVKMRF